MVRLQWNLSCRTMGPPLPNQVQPLLQGPISNVIQSTQSLYQFILRETQYCSGSLMSHSLLFYEHAAPPISTALQILSISLIFTYIYKEMETSLKYFKPMVKCGKKFHIIICPFKDSLCKNGFLLIYLRESEMSVWTLLHLLPIYFPPRKHCRPVIQVSMQIKSPFRYRVFPPRKHCIV